MCNLRPFRASLELIMKKSLLICLLAVVTCFLAAPALQAANTVAGKPGVSQAAAKHKNKKMHHKHKKHKKQKPANS